MNWLRNRMSPFGTQVSNILGMHPDTFAYDDFSSNTPRVKHEKLGEFFIGGFYGVRHKGFIPNHMQGQIIRDYKDVVSTRRLNFADQLVLHRQFREWQQRSVDLDAVRAALAPASKPGSKVPPISTATQVQAQQAQFDAAIAAASQRMAHKIDEDILKAFAAPSFQRRLAEEEQQRRNSECMDALRYMQYFTNPASPAIKPPQV